jgi:branched-chain amino acid transport system permease protein
LDFGPFLLLAVMEGLVMAAVLALTALGLSLVFGVMRVVNVAHGEFFMLGAVLAWFVTQWVPGPPALGFLPRWYSRRWRWARSPLSPTCWC